METENWQKNFDELRVIHQNFIAKAFYRIVAA